MKHLIDKHTTLATENIEITDIHESCLQRTEKWHQDRCGKFTGSRIKHLMSKGRGKNSIWGETAKKYIFEKYLERISGVIIKIPETYEMKRGTELEPIAKATFIERFAIDIHDCEFIDSPCGRKLGASPDGLNDSNIFEIKCRNGFAHFDYGLTLMNEDHDDFWQLICEMYSAGKNNAIYINYNPDFTDNGLDLIPQIVELSQIHVNQMLNRVDEAEMHIKAMMSLKDLSQAYSYIMSIN